MMGNFSVDKAYKKIEFKFAQEAIIHYEYDVDTQTMMYGKIL